MYRIIKSNGETLGIAENLLFIKRKGVNIIGTTDKDATGISYLSTPYNLAGTEGVGVSETVSLCAVDGGVVASEVGTVMSIAFVTLAERGDIDPVTAGEHAELFSPWAPGVKHEVGNLRKYNAQLYRCIQAHTSQADWTPDIAVSQWAKAADPAEEWPEWSQPIGAADAYNEGDKVRHNGKHWISTVNANVWEPGIYGWTEKGE